MRKHSKEFLENLTPYQGYELLVEGNKRFVGNLNTDHDHLEMINETREGQYPLCSDFKLYGFPHLSRINF